MFFSFDASRFTFIFEKWKSFPQFDEEQLQHYFFILWLIIEGKVSDVVAVASNLLTKWILHFTVKVLWPKVKRRRKVLIAWSEVANALSRAPVTAHMPTEFWFIGWFSHTLQLSTYVVYFGTLLGLTANYLLPSANSRGSFLEFFSSFSLLLFLFLLFFSSSLSSSM